MSVAQTYNNNFQISLFLSLIFHLIFFAIFSLLLNKSTNKEIVEKILDVKIVRIKEKPKQIVSPSEKTSTEAPKKHTYLSSKNSIVEKETIKRGLPNQNVSAIEKKFSKQKKQTQKKKTVKPKSLLVLNSKKTEKLYAKSKENQKTITKDKFRNIEQEKPFQTSRSFSIYANKSGLPDYLPKIQDGDITFLNTKADKHAVFVRRIALQVFGAIREKSWQKLSFSQVRVIPSFTTVKAIMSKSGKLLEVKLIESSGNTKFDDVLEESVSKGAWDQNPPKGAISTDGKIHFIFKARTWSVISGDGLLEKRWLLLGTGLL